MFGLIPREGGGASLLRLLFIRCTFELLVKLYPELEDSSRIRGVDGRDDDPVEFEENGLASIGAIE